MINEVTTLPEAQAVLAQYPTENLELWSPANAAETHGILWFCMLQSALRELTPNRELRLVLDCGDRGDLAVEALRLGLKDVALRASAEVTAKVADIAAVCGGNVITSRPTF